MSKEQIETVHGVQVESNEKITDPSFNIDDKNMSKNIFLFTLASTKLTDKILYPIIIIRLSYFLQNRFFLICCFFFLLIYLHVALILKDVTGAT